MNRDQRIRVVGLLEKERLTVYEACEVLEAVAKMVREIPGSIIQLNTECLEHEVNSALERAEALIRRFADFHGKLATLDDELYQKAEAVWKTAGLAKDQLRQRLEQLGDVPDVGVPYNVTQMIEIAERCSGLDDEQWGRVVDLAKALRHG